MTRNLRTQLADVAERWMRAWAGDDLPRESAEVLYTYWDLADPNDDELRDEVLSRFAPAEPPSVPGKDWLPGATVFSDAAEVIKVALSELPGTVLTAAMVNAAAEAVAVLDEPKCNGNCIADGTAVVIEDLCCPLHGVKAVDRG